MNEPRRGHWYLLTALLIGGVLGIVFAWWVFPLPLQATFPATLRTDYKDSYRFMIAASYAANGNLGRAQARLSLLRDKDVLQTLADQTTRMKGNNVAPNVVQNITILANALQTAPTSLPSGLASSTPAPLPSITAADKPVNVPTATPETASEPATPQSEEASPTPAVVAAETAISSPVATSAPTLAPRPTFTATFTPGPPFMLAKSTDACEPARPGLLQVWLKNANGQEVPGVELVITWAGGEEHFFTGLKPELGNGYADFLMQPDVEYALSLSNGNTRVTTLVSSACAAKDGTSTYKSIHLEFTQP